MARPTKTDNPRRSILEAAAKLLLEQGYRSFSLRAVAARAGFSPASLYEYFDSKEDLIGALAADASFRLGQAMAKALNGARSPSHALVELGLSYVRFARQHREDFLLLFSSLESQRRGLDEAVPAGSPYGLLLTTVRHALERKGKKVPPRAVDEMAYAFWATVHGMAVLQAGHLQGFKAEFEAVDRRALEALVRGYGMEE